jgi:hypothetical protein
MWGIPHYALLPGLGRARRGTYPDGTPVDVVNEPSL